MELTKNPYEMTIWEDHIVLIDENGNVIKDEKGNPVVLRQGTRFNAKRGNNIEKGIYDAYEMIILNKKDIQRLFVQLEIIERAPENYYGSFFDSLDGFSNRISMLKEQTEVIKAVSAGETVLQVGSTEGLVPFIQMTIYDDISNEDVLITKVNTDSIEVQPLVNSYKKGAVVARSSVEIDAVNKEMDIGKWKTYSIAGEVM